MNTYAHTTNYTQTIRTNASQEDLSLPVAKGSTRDVKGKMAQFKIADVSNFKTPFELKTVFRKKKKELQI